MTYPHKITASQPFSRETIEEDLTVNGYFLRRELDYRVETLIGKMYALRNSLDLELKRLLDEGVDHTLNSLGIIQGQAPEIDRLCGEIATLKDILRSTGAWQESWRK